MKIYKYIAIILAAASLIACDKNGQTYEGTPIVEVNVVKVSGTTADFTFRSLNTDYFMFLIDENPTASVETLLSNGEKMTGTTYLATELASGTVYYAHAVPVGLGGKKGNVQNVQFRTKMLAGQMYPWESARTELPDISDMALCYGYSTHREVATWNSKWPKARFAPMVSCLNDKGVEQWLFESYLALEFHDNDTKMTFCYDRRYKAADRAAWQRLIDYWFEKDNGFDALDQAIADAAKRIGEPKSKRFVILAMPDPTIHQYFDQESSTTVYWGELDGRKLDFGKADDRVAACEWYFDTVRERFSQANFQYIELIGFYIISEDIAIEGDGWSQHLKRNEEIFPEICEYLHSVNEGMYWIPYNSAAPYKSWKNLQLDLAIMQPNKFWDDKDEHPWPDFFKMINTYDMGMEFELDELILSTNTESNPAIYRERFRSYLSGAKANGVYGKKPVALYHGDDAFYRLSVSTDPDDHAIYRELVDYLLTNPRKKY